MVETPSKSGSAVGRQEEKVTPSRVNTTLTSLLLNYFDLFLSQAIDFVDELVDLLVGYLNLALDDSFLMFGFRCNKTLL